MLHLMKPYKAFLADEAVHNNVCQMTIHRLVKAHRYSTLVFRRFNSRLIFVTGISRHLQHRKSGRRHKRR